MERPFFHIRKRGHQFETRGTPRTVLTHEPVDNGVCRGPFVQWEWDGRRLQIRTDRYGIYPLYYWLHDDGIGVSPSIPRLLEDGASTALDETGLAVFLRLGFFIGEHTPFLAIRAVPPGATVEWKDGTLDVSTQGPALTCASISTEEARDRYAALFKRAIQRRVTAQGDCAVPLSGGRDSRHIALELCAVGCPPKAALTFRHLRPSRDEDTLVAAQLCGALGISHILLDQSPSRLQAELRNNIKTNFCADEHAQYLALADYVAGRYDCLYDGIGGDVLSNGLFSNATRLALFADGRFKDLAEDLFQAFPIASRFSHETLLRELLPPHQYRRFSRESDIASLSEELSRHAHAPNPVASFFFRNRTRREVALAPFSILGEEVKVLCPYLDHDVYDHLMSLPGHMFLGRSFHTDTIRHTYPAYAHIPFDNEVKAPTPKADGYYRRFGREMTWYSLTHGSSRLVRFSYLLPRLLKAALSAEYGETLFSYRHFGPHALYLLQLERHCRGAEGYSGSV